MGVFDDVLVRRGGGAPEVGRLRPQQVDHPVVHILASACKKEREKRERERERKESEVRSDKDSEEEETYLLKYTSS